MARARGYEYWILKGRTPVTTDDIHEWGRFMANAKARTVAVGERDGVTVSTVFLGLDHGFGSGAPVLFETLVVNGEYDGEMRRYSSWSEAELGHREMCSVVFGPPKEPAKHRVLFEE